MVSQNDTAEVRPLVLLNQRLVNVSGELRKDERLENKNEEQVKRGEEAGLTFSWCRIVPWFPDSVEVNQRRKRSVFMQDYDAETHVRAALLRKTH